MIIKYVLGVQYPFMELESYNPEILEDPAATGVIAFVPERLRPLVESVAKCVLPGGMYPLDMAYFSLRQLREKYILRVDAEELKEY